MESGEQMSAVITAIVGVVAFVAAAVVARPAGRALKRFGTWAIVVAGLVIVAGATALAFVGIRGGDDLLWGLALGIGFGGVSGLRYGRGTLLDMFGVHVGPTRGGRS
jgi:hypothetical protein